MFVLLVLNLGTVAIRPGAAFASNIPVTQQPSWTRLGPGGGEIDTLVADPLDPGTIYAGSIDPAAVFVTHSSGQNWEEADSGLNGTFLTSIAVSYTHEGNVFAVVGGNLFVSDDGGSTWRQSSECQGDATKYLVDPARGTVHLLACRLELLISTDAGSTWRQADFSSVLPTPVYVLDVEASGEKLFVLAEAVLEGQMAILSSDDFGNTWTSQQIQAEPVNPISPLAVSPLNESIMFLATEDGIIRSTDRGATWSQVVSDLPATTQGGFVAFDVGNPGVVYAGEAWLWRSTDDGKAFSEVANATRGLCGEEIVHGDYHVGVTSLLATSDGHLYVGTEGGVYVSQDEGYTWTCDSGEIKNSYVTIARVDPFSPEHIIAILAYDGVYQSFDWGRTWSPVSPPYRGGASDVEFDPYRNGTVYFLSQNSLVRSTDEGRTFAVVENVSCPESTCGLTFDPSDPSIAWLGGGEDGLFSSHDAGGEWESVGNFSYITASRVFLAGNSVYMYNERTSANCCLYESNDSGADWREIAVPFAFDNFAVDPSQSSNVFAGGNDMGRQIYVSADGGHTFVPVRTPADVQGGAVFPQRINGSLRLVLAGEGGPSGIYESYDCGKNWTSIAGDSGPTWVDDIDAVGSNQAELVAASDGKGILVANLTLTPEDGTTLNGNPCSSISPSISTTPEFGPQTLLVTTLASIAAVGWLSRSPRNSRVRL
ncbi:MAG TPA: hypothetical protein VLX56_00575 [Nitrososphaerales archaeon]|nr:hypothetical protein [Nitrososphaerales archaeon]